MKYRKKPVVIDAIQYDGANDDEIIELNDGDSSGLNFGVTLASANVSRAPFCDISTLEGVMRANVGDWVIRGIKGELYPCKPDIFAKSYDAVSE